MLAPDLHQSDDPLAPIAERLRALSQRSSPGAISVAADDPADLGRVKQIVEGAMSRMERTMRDRDARTAQAIDTLTQMIEDRPASRPVEQPAVNPVKTMIDQISGRLDVEPAPARPPRARDENIARLEAKLATILETLERKEKVDTMPAQPMAEQPPASPLQSMVDAVAERQRELDGVDAAEPQPPRDLRRQIETLTDRLGTGVAAQTINHIRELRIEIGSLSTAMAGLAPREAVDALEAAMLALAGKVADMRQQTGPLSSSRVEALLADLAGAVASLRDTSGIEAIRNDLSALSDRVAAEGIRNNDAEGLKALQTQVAELARMVTQARQPSHLERLEARVAKLSDVIETLALAPGAEAAHARLHGAIEDVRLSLDKALPTEVLIRLENRINELGGIEDRLGELAARLDQMPGRADIDALHARMEWMHSSIVSRVTAAEPAPPTPAPDLGPIEAMLRTLTAKMDAAGQEDDEKALEAIEEQIARIAERLDLKFSEPAPKEPAFDGIVDRIEDMRRSAVQAAEAAARTVAGSQPGAEIVAALVRDMNELRRAQTEADTRTQVTLAGLSTALGDIATRLAMPAPAMSLPSAATATIEEPPITVRPTVPLAPEATAAAPAAMPMPMPAPATASTAAPAAKPDVSPEQAFKAAALRRAMLNVMAKDSVRDTETAAAAAAVAPDTPIEPSVTPVEVAVAADEPAGEPAASGVDKSAFIAAARRAARAAQQQTEEMLFTEPAEKTPPKKKSRVKSALAARRKPIIVGLAAALIGIVAVQAITAWQADNAASLDAGSTKGEGKVAQPAQRQSVLAPIVPAKQAARAETTDPVQVGSLGQLPGVPDAKRGAEAPAQDTELPDLPPRLPNTRFAALTPLAAQISAERLRNGMLSGDPAALYEAAGRFLDGRNAPRDPAAAVKLLEAAAQQGSAPAQYRLGSLYREGRGVAADKAQALAWFKLAAENGNARAMHNVGVLLAEGVTGKPDYDAALAWFTKAAERNVRDSQYNLAILYGRGLGAPQDLSASYRWFSAAAQQGDEDAGHKRDDIAAKLPPEQLAAAKAAAKAWLPKPLDAKANDVPVPAEGWDAPVASTGSARPGRG